ncbi:hypothetical protein HAX54_008898 [Datura stramonium]|uniref:Uncharacterized protein n=1 Tax=Datura stramonium TaxID=4076 RepID=A0ABS8TFF9_DATST|nr:hypothetical protein [Datura stramonium]
MEIEVIGKCIKRLQKGTKGASSSPRKDGPTKRFGAQKVVKPHGLTWFNTRTWPKVEVRGRLAMCSRRRQLLKIGTYSMPRVPCMCRVGPRFVLLDDDEATVAE